MEPFYVKPFIVCPDCEGELVLAGTNYVCKHCGSSNDQMALLATLKTGRPDQSGDPAS